MVEYKVSREVAIEDINNFYAQVHEFEEVIDTSNKFKCLINAYCMGRVELDLDNETITIELKKPVCKPDGTFFGRIILKELPTEQLRKISSNAQYNRISEMETILNIMAYFAKQTDPKINSEVLGKIGTKDNNVICQAIALFTWQGEEIKIKKKY